MKLVRYGRLGREKPGLVDEDGKLRDLSGRIADITADQLSPKALSKLARINAKRLPLVKGRPRYGVPWDGPGKIVCIGLNYVDHAKETNSPIPDQPIIFLKVNCFFQIMTPTMIPVDSRRRECFQRVQV